MSEPIKVRVTHADIAVGELCDADKCPVALALNRATGRAWRVSHNYAENDGNEHIALPYVAELFQVAFDDGKPVRPFEFEVTT